MAMVTATCQVEKESKQTFMPAPNPGLTSALEHFTTLGVDALWITPIFDSPMADFGYDISDYRSSHVYQVNSTVNLNIVII